MATLAVRADNARPSATAGKIRVGIIGYGYWGPNVARNLHSLENCQLTAIGDKNPTCLREARAAYRNVELTTDISGVLTSTEIDAVAVVTPVWTHFDLAKAALQKWKARICRKAVHFHGAASRGAHRTWHVRKNLKIMVDHTFLFTGAVKKIRQLVDDGTLGELYYYDSMRVNLGLFQHDINVAWDLAPHDLAIMDYIIPKKPEAVVATGEKHLNGHVDVAFITVYFPGNVIAHINVNWLSPVKVRTTLIGGKKECWFGMIWRPTKKSRCTTKAFR